jgi:Tfp pilus assembly PilM family ATPase
MLAGEGGLKLTRALVERCGVTADEAEALKRRLGTSSAGHAASSDPAPNDRAAQSVIDRVTDSTLAAVRSSLDYFLGNGQDVEGLGIVVLTGGGAQLAGLPERLADVLDIEVRVADPLAGLTHPIKSGEMSPDQYSSLAVAAGLGLAEVA